MFLSGVSRGKTAGLPRSRSGVLHLRVTRLDDDMISTVVNDMHELLNVHLG